MRDDTCRRQSSTRCQKGREATGKRVRLVIRNDYSTHQAEP
jgi:hypothetical protein